MADNFVKKDWYKRTKDLGKIEPNGTSVGNKNDELPNIGAKSAHRRMHITPLRD